MSAVEGRTAKEGRDGPSTSSKRLAGTLEVVAAPSIEYSLATSKSMSLATTAAARDRERKIGHRRVDETTGQVTYKKKTTTDLMMAIQLGIGQSVGSLTSKPERDVLMQDFSVVETVNFPENGSNLTPAHRAGEFKFKTFAPVAFRYFRELFAIHMDDFLVSLCSDTLRELSNPGASGSIFFITEDDEFIIKTVQHKEAEFLQKLLPGYYMNLNQNPRTLLPKFYGLHCYQQGGKNIRFVIMNNLLPSSVKLHEKYDLKGSTHKRKASKYELAKESPTLKDLDFRERHPDGIFLEPDTHEALLKTIRRDCRVLESFKIMDYSLLLGVHNLDQARRERSQLSLASHSQRRLQPLSSIDEEWARPPAGISELPDYAGGAAGGMQRNKSVRQRLANFSTAMESIQAEIEMSVDMEDDEENTPAGGIPARNEHGDRLLLYVGIIDILQSYRLKKKLEHGFKSIVHDGDTISVHRPGFYAQRFQNFSDKEVFKKLPSPLRSPSRKKLARQRSVTDSAPDPPATTLPSKGLGAIGGSFDSGGLISSSRPDLIAAMSHHADAAASAADEPAVTKTTTHSSEAKSSVASAGSFLSTSNSNTNFDERRLDVRPSAAAAAAAAAASTAPTETLPLPHGPPTGGEHLPPYSEQQQPAADSAAVVTAPPVLATTKAAATSEFSDVTSAGIVSLSQESFVSEMTLVAESYSDGSSDQCSVEPVSFAVISRASLLSPSSTDSSSAVNSSEATFQMNDTYL